jgi:CxxC motif-containing protein (DUF1111 family)
MRDAEATAREPVWAGQKRGLVASVFWLALTACGDGKESVTSDSAGGDGDVRVFIDAGRVLPSPREGGVAPFGARDAGERAAARDGELGATTARCAEAPLAGLVASCGGCHALRAGVTASAPDLHAFAGDESAFLARVRSGSAAMPSFAADAISDATLRAAYARLRRGERLSDSPAEPGLERLFVPSPEHPLPVTFRRDDGVLITRGAGRVRQRHELEESFGPFGPLYFEHRTYGFLIEDFTERGESRVRVTYLPAARPTDGTNFRAFKIYGDGNVFHQNMGMTSDVALPSLLLRGADLARDYPMAVAPFARVQSQQVTREPRANRPLARGDLLEFEFGVFIDPAAVQSGTRTSYYSDTFRYRVGEGGLTVENRDASGTIGPRPDALQGGATTSGWLYAEPETYYQQMASNIQHEHVQRFVEGRRLFHTDFESGKHSEAGNPPLAEQANKLGPSFVGASCDGCHPNNGGGRALAAPLDRTSSMVFKLYDAGALGDQLQLDEGSARAAGSDERPVALADGTRVVLRRTRYELIMKNGARVNHSARVARRIVGVGLLEAIDEPTLLAHADPYDCDGDGISGRAQRIVEPHTGVKRLGRFGWKAEKVSVEHQVADALSADLGVDTRIVPGQGGNVELADADLLRLTTYMRLLAVPPQREAQNTARGRQLFASVGCAGCHTPQLETAATHPFVELRVQTVRPYTDLLLHDLGPDLADESGAAGDRTDGERASASEWRTAPLWGLGMARSVQGYVALLHDGRAASVLEAVLWHGGEAALAKQRFTMLPRSERDALLEFVESL